MAFRDTIRDYRKAATRRLEDARELMESPTFDSQRSDAAHPHLRGAMYLAGYAIERYLKAYLIQYANAQTLRDAVVILNEKRARQGREAIADISRSAAGHQVIYLLQLTDLTDRNGFDAERWGRLSQWKSPWRYESDTVNRNAAQRFMDDVQAAVNWVSSHISTS